jgi:hypothetical protein
MLGGFTLSCSSSAGRRKPNRALLLLTATIVENSGIELNNIKSKELLYDSNRKIT